MGGSVGQVYHQITGSAQQLYNVAVKGETPQPQTVELPGPIDAKTGVDMAQAEQARPKGAQATTYRTPKKQDDGLLSSGGSQSKRMLLGG